MVMAREGPEAESRRLNERAVWLLIVLGAASLLGGIIGVTAFLDAWPAIAAMVLVQLAVTAFGQAAPRRPVSWAVAVAAVCLGSALLNPALSELAYSGGTPWIGLAIAAATLNLYRNSSDWIALISGSAALLLGSAGLVAVSIRAGVPAATAVMATAVYFLLGVLAALLLHLRDARDDRVRRPDLAVELDGLDEQASPAREALAVARRALAIVALRSDELASSTSEVSARRAAADLRDVARRGLTRPGENDLAVARIEVHPSNRAPETAHSASEPGEEPSRGQTAPMPELPDREREILRLVATGASNAAIGRSLYLSEATVKQYVSKLMRRFERDNRTQLALMAVRWFDGT